MSICQTGANSTGLFHNTFRQVTLTFTFCTIRPEGSDGNGSNDMLMENDWNAHLSVPKFFAPCRGHTSSKDQFRKGKGLPLTHRVPHTMRSMGHHNLVFFLSQITASEGEGGGGLRR